MITVLVPSHGRPNLLAEALHSLRSQAGEWRAIVGDNGTTRGAKALCGDGIEYVRFPEVGSMAHGQRLLDLWDGEGYCCFLHDDDRLPPASLMRRAAYLDENPDVDVLVTAMREVGGASREFHKDPAVWRADYDSVWPNIAFPTLMFRGVVKDYPFDTDSVIGITDALWQFRMFMGGVRFGYLDEVHYEYRVHPGQESIGADPVLLAREQMAVDRIAKELLMGRDPKRAGIYPDRDDAAQRIENEMNCAIANGDMDTAERLRAELLRPRDQMARPTRRR